MIHWLYMIFGRLIEGFRKVLPSTPGNRLELANQIEEINRRLAEGVARLIDAELSLACSETRIAVAETGADVYLRTVDRLPPHVEGELAAREAFARIQRLWWAYATSELPYAAPVGLLLNDFSRQYPDTPIRELSNLIGTYADRMRAAEEVLSARH